MRDPWRIQYSPQEPGEKRCSVLGDYSKTYDGPEAALAALKAMPGLRREPDQEPYIYWTEPVPEEERRRFWPESIPANEANERDMWAHTRDQRATGADPDSARRARGLDEEQGIYRSY